MQQYLQLLKIIHLFAFILLTVSFYQLLIVVLVIKRYGANLQKK